MLERGNVQISKTVIMKVKKIIIIIALASVAIVASVATLRLLGGEDNWICENGNWVKHGSPSAPQPAAACPGSESVEEFTAGPD